MDKADNHFKIRVVSIATLHRVRLHVLQYAIASEVEALDRDGEAYDDGNFYVDDLLHRYCQNGVTKCTLVHH